MCPPASFSSMPKCTAANTELSRRPVIDNLRKGIDVLLDIDTKGAATIRTCGDPFVIDALVDVFIMPPNLEELRRRLMKRGTETEGQISTRLQNAGRRNGTMA